MLRNNCTVWLVLLPRNGRLACGEAEQQRQAANLFHASHRFSYSAATREPMAADGWACCLPGAKMRMAPKMAARVARETITCMIEGLSS